MNHSRRTWWQLIATLVAFTLISAACGSGTGNSGESATASTTRTGLFGEAEGGGDTDSDAPQVGGKVVVALEAESAGWRPNGAAFTISGITVATTIYDPLMFLNADGELEGWLAESMEANDDLTVWTLKLRPGITFHDGSPLDAETLKWNFDELHMADDSITRGSLVGAGILLEGGMEIVDDLTVTYNLSEPNSAFDYMLRFAIGWPISRVAYEANGPDHFNENPVGTGPFIFDQWIRGDRLVVKRNPNYWRSDANGQKLPYLNEVEFRPITDEDSRAQSLASDTVQVMVTLRGSTAKTVLNLVEERDYLANIHVGNESGTSLFNVLEPPVDDVRVRTALVAASNAESVAVVLGDDGLVPITTGFFSTESPWYSEVVAAAYAATDGVDLERATRLIEEYKNDPNRSDGRNVGDPVTVIYSCLDDPSLLEIGQLYQADWGNIGVEVTLRQLQQQEHVELVVGHTMVTEPPLKGDYMVACWRAGGGTGDPLAPLALAFGDPSTSAGNVTNFYDPEITEQLDILRTSADFETRYAAVERIGVIANEAAIMTWSIATPTLVGWRDDIRGITTWTLPSGSAGTGTPSGWVNFSQVYLQ